MGAEVGFSVGSFSLFAVSHAAKLKSVRHAIRSAMGLKIFILSSQNIKILRFYSTTFFVTRQQKKRICPDFCVFLAGVGIY